MKKMNQIFCKKKCHKVKLFNKEIITNQYKEILLYKIIQKLFKNKYLIQQQIIILKQILNKRNNKTKFKKIIQKIVNKLTAQAQTQKQKKILWTK